MAGLRREDAALALVLLATAGVYARVAGFGFAGTDDPLYVAENPFVRAGLTWESVAYAFRSTVLGNWHPLTWLSWMLDQELHGGGAGGFHLTNVLLHLTTTALLYAWLARLTGRPLRAACVAGLFALHPLRVESVAWIAERKDSLSGVFWMLGLACHLHYVRRPGARRYALLWGVFALGLMTKPMLVTLPFVMLLVDAWPLGRLAPGPERPPAAWRRAGALLAEKLPLIALSVVFGLVTLRIHQGQGAVGDLSLEVRAANAALAYAHYLRDTLWPMDLAFFYPHPQEAVSRGAAAAAAGLLAGLTALAVVLRRRAPYLLVGWLWFVGALLPVIGMHDQARADRYTYLPGIGLALALTWGAAELAARLGVARRALAPAAVAVLAALSVATWQQLSHWRDPEAIYRRALAVTPGDVRLLYDLGTWLDRVGREPEAEELLREVVRQHPTYLPARLNLGQLLVGQNRLDEALVHYRAARRAYPKDARIHFDLGLVYSKQWKLDRAIAAFSRALELDPDLDAARVGLVGALVKDEDTQAAIAELRRLLERRPGDARARALLRELEAQASEESARVPRQSSAVMRP